MSTGPGLTRAYIGLGANLGDPRVAIENAVAALAEHPQVHDLRLSSWYRSTPIESAGPEYLNAVAELHTDLAPHALLVLLQALELQGGRERPYRNAPRTLDLDLLLHGTYQCADAQLTLPHPRLHVRAFVLLPLCELAPDVVLPGLGPAVDWLPVVAGQGIEKLPC